MGLAPIQLVHLSNQSIQGIRQHHRSFRRCRYSTYRSHLDKHLDSYRHSLHSPTRIPEVDLFDKKPSQHPLQIDRYLSLNNRY